jgi:predicted ArsR family transcriptional regulator
MAEQQQDRFEGLPVGARVEAVAQLMREQGHCGDDRRQDGLYYLHECTCPYPAVARRNSAVCALEWTSSAA